MNNSYISPFAKPVYVMLKPVGSVCNPACEYCYYLEKGKLYPEVKNHIMSEQLLEKIHQRLSGMPDNASGTLHLARRRNTDASDKFLQKALELQQKYGRGRQIDNCIQTNGTLLTDDWCRFFKRKQLSGWNINRRSAGISRRIPPEPPGPSLLLQSDEGNRVAEKNIR